MSRFVRSAFMRSACVTAACAALAAGTAAAAEPTEADVVAVVDRLLEDAWEEAGVGAAPWATDTEFLRRLTLDVLGRIPSVGEVRAFAADPDRDAAVARLTSSPAASTRLARLWRTVLLPRGVDLEPFGGTAVFEEWLRTEFARGAGYDEIVRDLLAAEGRVGEPGPVLFYTAHELAAEKLATRTARAFLGVRLDCAQCHDHPFDHWTQGDFWGVAAYFAQISRPEGAMEEVSSVLRVKDVAYGEVTLPESEEVIAPRLPPAVGGIAIDTGPFAPAGAFTPPGRSRRQTLSAWITDANNAAFARATVNRIWAAAFGRGVVDPPDDMSPTNPPAVPGLLGLLADDFVRHGFDVRRTWRIVLATRAYGLSSRGGGGGAEAERVFARMPIKVLDGDQLLDAILTATGRGAGDLDPTARARFLTAFARPSDDVTSYHVGVTQVLTLMNGTIVGTAADAESSPLAASLEAPFFTDADRIETVYLATLSRPPGAAERTRVADYFASKSGAAGRRRAVANLTWALLNSAEFSLNH